MKEYQAPEVQQGEAPTAVSDLWAVGMMMFHAVFRDAVPVPVCAQSPPFVFCFFSA